MKTIQTIPRTAALGALAALMLAKGTRLTIAAARMGMLTS